MNGNIVGIEGTLGWEASDLCSSPNPRDGLLCDLGQASFFSERHCCPLHSQRTCAADSQGLPELSRARTQPRVRNPGRASPRGRGCLMGLCSSSPPSQPEEAARTAAITGHPAPHIPTWDALPPHHHQPDTLPSSAFLDRSPLPPGHSPLLLSHEYTPLGLLIFHTAH